MRFAAVLISLVMCSVAAGQQSVYDVQRFGATPNDATDDTTAIQAAIDAAEAFTALSTSNQAIIKFPRGVYIVGTSTLAGSCALNVGDDDDPGEAVPDGLILSGEGTLKLGPASAADAIMVIDGDYITVEGLKFDGNEAGLPTGRGECLRIAGDYNTVRGVYACNTNTNFVSSVGVTFKVSSTAVGTLIEGCTSFESGSTALDCDGDFTTVRDFRALEHAASGFSTGGEDNEQLTIDGWYSSSQVTTKTGLLIDNGIGTGASAHIGYNLQHANLSNIIVDCGSNANYGNGVKFARVHNLNIDKMQVIHTSNAFHSLRMAEGMGNVRISDSHFSCDIVQERGAYDITGSISAAADNGSGFVRFTSASHVLKTGDVITITGTTSYNGVHYVTASTTPGTTFDTTWKYVADETGTFAAGLESFTIENSTIGTIGQSAATDAFDTLKANRIVVRKVRAENFTDIGIDLEDPAYFPVAGYKSIDVEDCDFIGNSASTMFAFRSETTAFSQPNVLSWKRNNIRSIGAGTIFVTQTNTTPYLIREEGMKRKLLSASTAVTNEESNTLYRVDAADLTVSLPAVSGAAGGGAGMTYTFILSSAGLSTGTGLTIRPDGNDAIFLPGVNDGVEGRDLILAGVNDHTGDTITLVSDGVDGWYVKSAIGRWTIQNDKDVYGDGKVIISATGTTLTPDQSGLLIIVAAPDLTYTLPPTVAGVRYTFTLGSDGLSAGGMAAGLHISPDAANRIFWPETSANLDKDMILDGDTDRNGDSITLIGDGSQGWYVENYTGTWSKEPG